MSDKPSVLFVCVHNAGRSQMAAGWLTHLAGNWVEVRSAGSLPGERINPVAVEAMREVGVDIAGEQPKALTTAAVEASDVVVTMGCGDACPIFPANGTKIGSSTILRGKPLTLSAQSAMKSAPKWKSSLTN